MSGPRVRFAPSPTGYFHVGSARSALFNWLVARQDPAGVFILRIEDTDAQLLRRSGYLYYCDCSLAQIEKRKGPGATPGYDGYCRDRGVERGTKTALRFRTPREGVTVVHDLIRGDVRFVNNLIEDFVVVRSSGIVLYALANVTDDRHDRITHVIRGEEHLANAPKQMMLWEGLKAATGVEVPLAFYAHLPLLVNEQRN